MFEVMPKSQHLMHFCLGRLTSSDSKTLELKEEEKEMTAAKYKIENLVTSLHLIYVT